MLRPVTWIHGDLDREAPPPELVGGRLVGVPRGQPVQKDVGKSRDKMSAKLTRRSSLWIQLLAAELPDQVVDEMTTLVDCVKLNSGAPDDVDTVSFKNGVGVFAHHPIPCVERLLCERVVLGGRLRRNQLAVQSGPAPKGTEDEYASW